MLYLKPSFSLPAAPSKVTQEEWDRIFGGHTSVSSTPVVTPDPYVKLVHLEGWKSDGQIGH
jgi:hypothetical protein